VVYHSYYAQPAPVAVYAPAYRVHREWVWRDGWYWDRGGNRYYRDGRPCDEEGYGRRGYDDRGYERGYDRDYDRDYGRGYDGQRDYRGR
jgi:hypothetical protein